MNRHCWQIAVFTAAALAISCFSSADDVPASPTVKPPKIKVLTASMVTLGEAQFAGCVLEVTNPNTASLIYTGYTPDSFEPQLPPGRISPLVQIELLQDKQWKPYPRGFCGTGLADIELKPKSTSTFEVSFPAGDWQAVKVGFGQMAGWSDEEQTTTTLWSVIVTREEFDKLLNPPGTEPHVE